MLVLDPETIQAKINTAPELASLRSVNQALAELLRADTTVTTQIADIIRRDPSLTARLLKLVNSAFFGLSNPIHSIEEAVLYLGMRQIKQLAMATPIIEDFTQLQNIFSDADWQMLWQHAIACAILTREILSLAQVDYEDDTDYVAGLIHNIGIIVTASLFPDYFEAILEKQKRVDLPLYLLEKQILGWDHAQIGAYYLKRHGLSDELIEATAYHHTPDQAPHFRKTAAAVQLADVLAQSIGLSSFEKPISCDWTSTSGWQILFQDNEEQTPFFIHSLQFSLQHLKGLIAGMI